jgi:hypothetical protein
MEDEAKWWRNRPSTPEELEALGAAIQEQRHILSARALAELREVVERCEKGKEGQE